MFAPGCIPRDIQTLGILCSEASHKNFSEVVARRCSIEIGVTKNFTQFTRKDLCQSLFSLAQVFSCNVCEIFKNTFCTEHLRTTTSDFPY